MKHQHHPSTAPNTSTFKASAEHWQCHSLTLSRVVKIDKLPVHKHTRQFVRILLDGIIRLKGATCEAATERVIEALSARRRVRFKCCCCKRSCSYTRCAGSMGKGMPVCESCALAREEARFPESEGRDKPR